MLGLNEILRYRSKVIKLAEITLADGGSTTGNTRTDLKNVRQFHEGVFFIRHTGLVGTTKTLDVIVESRDPSGAYWHELFAFTQITASAVAGGEIKKQATLGENICISWTKGHVDIVTTFTVYAVLKI